MRLILLCSLIGSVFVAMAFMPDHSNAEFLDEQPMNRCFAGKPPVQTIVNCLKEDSKARESVRIVVEDEAVGYLTSRQSDVHSPEMRISDIQNLKLSRKLFEDYKSRECSNHQTFRRDKKSESLYAFYFCNYQMSSDRIRILEDLMN